MRPSSLRSAAVVALSVTVLSVTALVTPPAAAAPTDTVHDYLQRHRESVGSPGLAYAVVRNDSVVAQGTFGTDGDGAPVTPRTAFLLGSVAKPFAGLAVAQLAEAGRLDVDAPVVDTLPWFRLADREVSDRITTEHLLTHTSGISAPDGVRFADRFDNTDGAVERAARALADAEPAGPPGGAFRYSSANYMVLGALVEKVSGSSYADYLRQHVLEPLRMRDAVVDEATTREHIPPGHRLTFDRAWRFDTEYDESGVPYGYLGGSLTDLTNFAIAQLNGGTFAGTEVPSAEATARTHEGRVETSSGSYGYGWRTRDLDGVRTVHHSGATAGYMSSLVLVPEQDLAVIVLHNAHGMARDVQQYEAAFNVVRLLQGGTPHDVGADPLLAYGPWVLLGLAAVVVALLARTALRKGPRSVLRTSIWCGAALLSAFAAGWILPRQFGAGLREVMLWAPDMAIGIIAVLVACALTLGTHLTLWLRHVRTGHPS
ncbi:serine hydrolase domain-containing protein [Polymorphospora lycopeni]|uniref:Serine hydrolase domain-containing protein n=1 Tax=Polymorphospora lycopeni TaxID=3140240 RepID=A0ABV5D2U6_9ACTN